MQLKYGQDIKWNDLARIEKPTFAIATIRRELNSPFNTLRGGFAWDKNPLDQIRRPGRREIDHDKLRQFYADIEDCKILLIHDFDLSEHHKAFKFVNDDAHPNKGKWTLGDHVLSNAQYQLEGILQAVKKPQQRGSIKTAASAIAPEYGYLPSSKAQAQGTSVGESTVAEAANTIGLFLYKVGSRTVVLATLTPGTAGGTTTYEISNEPDLRIIESDLEPARYQRRVDGEWQTTGVPANRVVDDYRSLGFEALSPEDAASLKSTGGIPITPQAKPTIEGYPPDSPPDTSRLAFPDQSGEVDNSTSSFPGEGSKSMGNPGYGDTDARDVVGSSVMYNEAGDGDLKAGKGIVSDKAVVTAKAEVGGSVFTDVNQTARVGANAKEPTLVSERITAKALKTGKELPNASMGTAHAEIGTIQQAFDAGKTKGADMTMTVTGKDVCGYCKGDIAAAAETAELKSLTIQAADDVTGLSKTYQWVQGMKSIKEKP